MTIVGETPLTYSYDQKQKIRAYFREQVAGTAVMNRDDMEFGLRLIGIEIDSDSHVFTGLLDECLFRCECCGWWCDRDEESFSDTEVCDECHAQ